jgi:hypothetical protein
MKDINGIEVWVNNLSWSLTCGDHLEIGSARLAKKWVLMSLGPGKPGRLVFGIGLQADDELPPPERIRARLKSLWRPPGANLEEWGYSEIEIEWFQHEGDPFVSLANRVATLDWSQHAVGVTP